MVRTVKETHWISLRMFFHSIGGSGGSRSLRGTRKGCNGQYRIAMQSMMSRVAELTVSA